MHRNEPSHIIGIMVQFQEELIDNPLTSGNGLFLNTLDVDFIAFNDKMRCNNNDHILLDRPPHDRDYFLSQLKAVNNYFANLNKNFNYSVLVLLFFTTSGDSFNTGSEILNGNGIVFSLRPKTGNITKKCIK